MWNSIHMIECLEGVVHRLTKDFAKKDTFDQIEFGVRSFRQAVRGHWIVVQLENGTEESNNDMKFN